MCLRPQGLSGARWWTCLSELPGENDPHHEDVELHRAYAVAYGALLSGAAIPWFWGVERRMKNSNVSTECIEPCTQTSGSRAGVAPLD